MNHHLYSEIFKLVPSSFDDYNDKSSPSLSRCSMCKLLYEEHLAITADGDGVCLACVEANEELTRCLECGTVADMRRHDFCPSCGLTFRED